MRIRNIHDFIDNLNPWAPKKDLIEAAYMVGCYGGTTKVRDHILISTTRFLLSNQVGIVQFNSLSTAYEIGLIDRVENPDFESINRIEEFETEELYACLNGVASFEVIKAVSKRFGIIARFPWLRREVSLHTPILEFRDKIIQQRLNLESAQYKAVDWRNRILAIDSIIQTVGNDCSLEEAEKLWFKNSLEASLEKLIL